MSPSNSCASPGQIWGRDGLEPRRLGLEANRFLLDPFAGPPCTSNVEMAIRRTTLIHHRHLNWLPFAFSTSDRYPVFVVDGGVGRYRIGPYRLLSVPIGH